MRALIFTFADAASFADKNCTPVVSISGRTGRIISTTGLHELDVLSIIKEWCRTRYISITKFTISAPLCMWGNNDALSDYFRETDR
jgi:hypothetical protein